MQLTINGQTHPVPDGWEQEPLLWLLRETAGRVGTRFLDRFVLNPHTVTRHSASTTIDRLILDSPRSRSTNVIGTSTTRKPARQACQARSTWKQYPCEATSPSGSAARTSLRYARKPPVASASGSPSMIRV